MGKSAAGKHIALLQETQFHSYTSKVKKCMWSICRCGGRISSSQSFGIQLDCVSSLNKIIWGPLRCSNLGFCAYLAPLDCNLQTPASSDLGS